MILFLIALWTDAHFPFTFKMTANSLSTDMALVNNEEREGKCSRESHRSLALPVSSFLCLHLPSLPRWAPSLESLYILWSPILPSLSPWKCECTYHWIDTDIYMIGRQILLWRIWRDHPILGQENDDPLPFSHCNTCLHPTIH